MGRLGRRSIFIVLVLTVVWILLMEELSAMSVAMGVVIGTIVMLFSKKFLPLQAIHNVSFRKLITYPFYLVGQIYAAGFAVIKIIITGSVVDIVTVKTQLKNEALRVMLADSITLTPGSILLSLEKENLTLLWIRGKDTPGDSDTAGEILKGGLEKRLLKAERDA